MIGGYEQLLVHIFGDYIVQSDWMAMNKSKKSFPCLVHVLIYTSCFLMLTTSWKALLLIGGTHFILDRFHIIVQKLIWYKNHLNPWFGYVPFDFAKYTGYYDTFRYTAVGAPEPIGESTNDAQGHTWRPRLNYVTLWLYIITDNFIHLTINYFALKYLS